MGTRGEWSIDFLKVLGNSSPDENTIRLVSAWTKAEGTKAEFNPLATTYVMPGSSEFNRTGVQNYATRDDGIQASVKTLNSTFTGYARLREGLIKNDVIEALTSGGFDTWGTHTSSVLINYNNGDHRNEILMSDTTGGASDIEKKSKSGELHPILEKSSDEKSSEQVTEQDIRNFGKSFLGAFLIFAGLVVLTIMIARSDTTQNTLALAAKVAEA